MAAPSGLFFGLKGRKSPAQEQGPGSTGASRPSGRCRSRLARPPVWPPRVRRGRPTRL